MDWLKRYWGQLTVLVGILTGGGAWVATADTYHEQTKENAAISSRAVEAVEQLRAQNQLQSLTLRLLCQEEEHKAESVCRAIDAQDRARAAAAKAAAEAAVR